MKFSDESGLLKTVSLTQKQYDLIKQSMRKGKFPISNFSEFMRNAAAHYIKYREEEVNDNGGSNHTPRHF